MEVLSKQGVLGGDNIGELPFCEHSVYGKMHKVKFKTGQHCTKRILDYGHNDLWGPTKKTSHVDIKYFFTFLDDNSRNVWISKVPDYNHLNVFRCTTYYHANEENGT